MSTDKLTIKDIALLVLAAVLLIGIMFTIDYREQISLQLYGDIEDSKVQPIFTGGALLEPVLPDKTWAGCYTIGYANSTNKFYVRYEFVYFFRPHKVQYTKWQEAPQELLDEEWDTIILFAGNWLPEKAYVWHLEFNFTIRQDAEYTYVYEGEYTEGKTPLFKSKNAVEALNWVFDHPSTDYIGDGTQ